MRRKICIWIYALNNYVSYTLVCVHFIVCSIYVCSCSTPSFSSPSFSSPANSSPANSAISLEPPDQLLRPGRGAEYCDQFVCLYVCVSVCVCVCLSVRDICLSVSGTAGPIFTKFLCRSPVAVVRSSSGSFAISYELPVLWMMMIIIIIIFYFHLKNQTRYGAKTYRIIEMVGCQKSKCSSSWPPILSLIHI